MSYFFVFLGGGLGSLFRFFISRLCAKFFPFFPLGTMISNFLGMFLIGFLSILILDKNAIISPYREMILVGFIGGLTTFSSFGYETYVLLAQSRWIDFFIYFFGNLFVGFFLFMIGRILGNL
ncbi:MAG: fluoride efflux transporter CrcB [Leptonema sp. (in: bacteria)]